ncbi:MAG: DUF3617 family protein [Novosphingobium sp.]
MTMTLRIAAIGCGLVAIAAVPAAGQGTELAMLDQLQKGNWEIRLRGSDEGMQKVCLADGRGLIQLRHRNSNCEKQIVSDGAREVAVQYTCRGQGYGLTRIRKETDKLVQIDSQGVANGQPFNFSAEARRVGDCAG